MHYLCPFPSILQVFSSHILSMIRVITINFPPHSWMQFDFFFPIDISWT